MKLKALTCKTASTKEKPYKLFDGKGLYLEIMPNGSKYWRMKYRFQNREKRLAIGVYPEISLLEARQECDDARKMLREGQDPSSLKKTIKMQSQKNNINNFEAIGREWHKKKCPQ